MIQIDQAQVAKAVENQLNNRKEIEKEKIIRNPHNNSRHAYYILSQLI